MKATKLAIITLFVLMAVSGIGGVMLACRYFTFVSPLSNHSSS